MRRSLNTATRQSLGALSDVTEEDGDQLDRIAELRQQRARIDAELAMLDAEARPPPPPVLDAAALTSLRRRLDQDGETTSPFRPRPERQSVASQFSDVSELQDFLADDYVEKFRARSPPQVPRSRRAPSLDQPSTPTDAGEVMVHPRKSFGTQNKVRARTEGTRRLVNDYEMLGELGRGACGRVERCVDAMGRARAIKVLRRGLSMDDVRREVCINSVPVSCPSMIIATKPYLSRRTPPKRRLPTDHA